MHFKGIMPLKMHKIIIFSRKKYVCLPPPPSLKFSDIYPKHTYFFCYLAQLFILSFLLPAYSKYLILCMFFSIRFFSSEIRINIFAAKFQPHTHLVLFGLTNNFSIKVLRPVTFNTLQKHLYVQFQPISNQFCLS